MDRPRILVAQPKKSYLADTARRISEQGYRVSAAATVHEAMAELYRQPVGLVLAELKEPGFSGAELVRMIRDDAALRDTPILLFTGRSDHSAAIQALRLGADGVVKKPFHFEVLCARIDRELERKRALDELRADNRVLDARVVQRAIELGELRDQLRKDTTVRR